MDTMERWIKEVCLKQSGFRVKIQKTGKMYRILPARGRKEFTEWYSRKEELLSENPFQASINFLVALEDYNRMDSFFCYDLDFIDENQVAWQ